MRIGVLGINSKLAGLQLRDSLAKAAQNQFTLHLSPHGEHSILLLSTCNRTELYFASEDLAAAHAYILSVLRQGVEGEFDQKLYTFFGIDCFLHLCRVTTGLDSALIGETEIQGQVKNAYEQAAEHLALPKELHFLFQKALMIGKKARGLLPSQGSLFGIEHAVIAAGKEHFQDISPLKTLFVGASEINCKVINALKLRKTGEIAICNRSKHKAEALAESLHVKWIDWSQIDNWHHFDWLIFGTKSSAFLFTEKSLQAPFDSKKLLIDLSVPRNVDPIVSTDPRISLQNIDQLNDSVAERRQQMKQFLWRAEELIANAVRLHAQLFAMKTARYYPSTGSTCSTSAI